MECEEQGKPQSHLLLELLVMVCYRSAFKLEEIEYASPNFYAQASTMMQEVPALGIFKNCFGVVCSSPLSPLPPLLYSSNMSQQFLHEEIRLHGTERIHGG